MNKCVENLIEYENKLKFIDVRFVLAVLIGGTIAFFGIISTIILIRILFAKQFRNTFCLYFAFLAILDLMLMAFYFMLICTEVIYQYFGIIALREIYMAYVIPIYTVALTTQYAQNLLVVAATAERCLLAMKVRKYQSVRQRCYVVIGVAVIAIALRCLVYWELEVTRFSECIGFASVKLQQSESLWKENTFSYYKFSVEPIFLVYIPFFLLLFFNGVIVSQLRRNYKKNSNSSCNGVPSSRTARQRMFKNATLILFYLVMCYLLANVLNVSMSILEQSEASITEHPKYHIANDLSSVLVVITVSARIFIYYSCNCDIKFAILNMLNGKSSMTVAPSCFESSDANHV